MGVTVSLSSSRGRPRAGQVRRIGGLARIRGHIKKDVWFRLSHLPPPPLPVTWTDVEPETSRGPFSFLRPRHHRERAVSFWQQPSPVIDDVGVTGCRSPVKLAGWASNQFSLI